MSTDQTFLDNATVAENVTIVPVRLAEEVLKALVSTNTQIESITGIVDFVIQILVYVIYALIFVSCILCIGIWFLAWKQRRKSLNSARNLDQQKCLPS